MEHVVGQPKAFEEADGVARQTSRTDIEEEGDWFPKCVKWMSV